MIVGLGEAADHPDQDLGRKAQGLADLMAAGFDVPDGFVLTDTWLRRVEDEPAVREQWAADLAGQLARWEPGTLFAVRSSSADEDLDDLSFAGQYRTLLDVPADGVLEAALECRASARSEAVLTYRTDHGLTSDGQFCVLVQQMVPASHAGVAFSINPLTGADTEVVVEVVEGLGEALVSGQVRPERFVDDWWHATSVETTDLLSPAQQAAVVELTLAVQTHLGHPCDLEFAITGAADQPRVHLLQARPITRVHHAGITDQWTNADFKDGGVSSTVCTPMMWSLYESIWERWLARFMLDSALLTRDDLRQLGRMFFGRPYWNLSVVKQAMAVVPGYVERQFDEELGVRVTYAGPGATTPTTPRTLARIAQVAWRQRSILTEHRDTVEQTQADLLARADQVQTELDTRPGPDQTAALWRRLVHHDYQRSEGTYFWQIFLNTIHQQLARERIQKVVGDVGYFHLISGLPVVSHLRPFHDAWTTSRAIHDDPASLAWWTTTPREQIVEALDAGDQRHHLDEVRAIIAEHGHHSVRELDITHPNFDQDHLAVVTMVADTVALDDSYSPDHDRARLESTYTQTLAQGLSSLPRWRRARFARTVERTRTMLWWREELRDTSTRYYHLLRQACLQLSSHLAEAGTLDQVDDIWFTTVTEVTDHLEGRLDADHLRRRVARHRRYHDSFRQFTPPNELGRSFDAQVEAATASGDGTLVGLGASPGRVTGTARVVQGLEEVDRIQPGDILVTRFTDTGWTGKFALVQAVVTEYGGVLCHASIVSREYGIPCVVALHDAMRHVPDGATITVDGSSGEVVIHL
ncbi:PEP/pyruvate-binding domain-containing protein [Aestuariimicrobium ganziense]|uniref:PEP/pyruvate-binding domain-containing protein n=1 Tax=Aestuariimicrobium ganziense TaxID=2773677 RepID=UPI001945197E|nr:PEP/pyruvate-binding domain-containing protein [Aestuariimicrobium ganziense]